MTFTYDAENVETDLARVRLRIGDTNERDQLLQDEEISVVLEEDVSLAEAALKCCRLIIAHLARDVDTSGGGMSVNRSQKVQHYKDLIEQLEAEVEGDTSLQPSVTVEALAPSYAASVDTGAFHPPSFSVGMDDHRG